MIYRLHLPIELATEQDRFVPKCNYTDGVYWFPDFWVNPSLCSPFECERCWPESLAMMKTSGEDVRE